MEATQDDLSDTGFDMLRSEVEFDPGPSGSLNIESTMLLAPELMPLKMPFPDVFPDITRSGSSGALCRGLKRDSATANCPLSLMPVGINLDASSNSGGELPDLGNLIPAGEAEDGMEMQRHREKNRAAQKRFRQRQKARMATSAQQVQELAHQMQQLKFEQQRLVAQNRVLQYTVRLSTRHIQDTAVEGEAFTKQQERILMETGGVYWRGVKSEPLSLEDAKKVTMEAFISIFEHFLGRYRVMLENGGRDPSTPAGRQLRDTVLDRRQEEARAAMFSHWISAAYAWNKEETARGVQPPSPDFWTTILDNLELSHEQQQAMLVARQRLLKALAGIRRDRERGVLELGLAIFQRQAAAERRFHEQQLRNSLELEREAVLDFLYTVVDCTFEPWQEAAADLHSHPWHPDLWAMCNILASRSGAQPPDISTPTSSTSLLPHFSAAEMLWTPILARGAGLQLKRVLVSRETPEDVIASAAKSPPTIARMRGMTMFQLFCGEHLSEVHPGFQQRQEGAQAGSPSVKPYQSDS